jgi:hypothetical protein
MKKKSLFLFLWCCALTAFATASTDTTYNKFEKYLKENNINIGDINEDMCNYIEKGCGDCASNLFLRILKTNLDEDRNEIADQWLRQLPCVKEVSSMVEKGGFSELVFLTQFKVYSDGIHLTVASVKH